MFKKLILLFLFNFTLAYIPSESGHANFKRGLSNKECVKRIYSGCNHPTHFTDYELENVRQFLNYSFTVLADIKPDKPLCRKIHVRQDWKCLTQHQKERVSNVWKIMYKKGDIQLLADLHAKVWPAWHKTMEAGPSHRWLITEFEKIMQSIDPGTTLPYYESPIYGAQPERSSIWETLGHSGKYSNGYDVPDGIYPEIHLATTVKRHWPNGTIPPWTTPEFITYLIQSSRSLPDFNLKILGLHFQPHLNVGGYEGQMSYRVAPYE